MALQFQHVPIRFQGLDTKTDERNVIDGRYIVAENAVMQKTGRVENRRGHVSPYGTALPGAVWAALAGSAPLALLASSTASNLVELSAGSALLSDLPPLLTFGGAKSLGSIFAPLWGFAVSGNRALFCFGGGGQLFVQLLDLDNQRVVKSTSFTGVTDNSIRVSASGSTFALLMHRSTWRVLWSTADAGGFLEEAVPGMAAFSAALVDVDVNVSPAGNIAVAMCVPTDKVYAQVRSSVAWGALQNSTGFGTAFSACALGRDAAGGWHFATVTTGTSNALRLATVSAAGAFGAVTNITTPSLPLDAARPFQVAICGPTQVAISYVLDKTDGSLKAAGEVTVIWGGGSTWYSQWGSRLAAKAYAGADGAGYFTLVDLQEEGFGTPASFRANLLGYATYYVLRRTTGEPRYLASYLGGTAYAKPAPSGTADPRLFAVNEFPYAAGGYFVGAKIRATDASGAASAVSHEAFKLESRLPTVAARDGAVITDAWGDVYEISSKSLYPTRTPLSFPFAPEPPVLADGGAGSLTGTYGFVVVYEFRTANGRKTYSAPSKPRSITVAGRAITFSVRTPYEIFSVPAYGTALTVTVAVYRTQANGQVYYLLESRDFDGSVWNLTDTTSDDTLAGREPLYANGGIVDAGNINPSLGVFTAKGRLWSISAENPNIVYFSALVDDSTAPYFNEALQIRTDELGGRIVAVAEMDEKIVLLKENAIYVTAGEGPNNDGVTGAYPTPQLVSQSVGCKWPRSVVLTDAGLAFMSAEGIYLLSRGLELAYLGAGVEDYNGLTITDALNLVDRHECWFLSSQGTALCWNEFHSQWSAFTGMPTNAALLLADGTPAHINATSGKYLVQSAAAYNDAGVPFRVRLKTGRMTFTGINGYQRFRALQWSGQSSDVVTVRATFDFDTVADETFTVVPASVGTPFQFEIRPARQKCEAAQFEIETADLTGPVWFSTWSIGAGAKRGSNRLPASKRVQGV